MKTKDIFQLQKALHAKFFEQFEFNLRDVTFNKISEYLQKPKDPSSLAVTRILFGLTMLIDIPMERGGSQMDKRWGDPKTCHFPLLPFVVALPMPYMAVVYGIMWLGALGSMLGYKYHLSAPMFAVCHWYILLIEKSFWNNHSYLFGLVAFLLVFTEANCYWSLDVFLNPSLKKERVPYWNYFVLKYQFFILYFMAGVKKGSVEWLTGYSLSNLGGHWVFYPFRLFLNIPQIDLLIVHWFIFAFDLTIAFWMMWKKTRNVAMVFCAMFHLMNIRLFSIGMFPWVCLATMPLFYPFDWPKKTKQKFFELDVIKNIVKTNYFGIKNFLVHEPVIESENSLPNNIILPSYEDSEVTSDDSTQSKMSTSKEENEIKTNGRETAETNESILKGSDNSTDEKPETFTSQSNPAEIKPIQDIRPKFQKNKIIHFIFIYMFVQAFLPFSHFITKGYNNWTKGLYGYSWDMMIEDWDIHSIIVRVVDNESQMEFFIDPDYLTLNNRWSRHGDMVYQFAHCLKNRIINNHFPAPEELSNNFSIYIESWASLNGRVTQKMFDPSIDLLQTIWTPFQKVPFLIPMYEDSINLRSTIKNTKEEVRSWSNSSDVIFLIEFPGSSNKEFISEELDNVTLTVVDGELSYESENTTFQNSFTYKLSSGDQVQVPSGYFYSLKNIGKTPAIFMLSFYDMSVEGEDAQHGEKSWKNPFIKEFKNLCFSYLMFGDSVLRGIYQTFFRLSMLLKST